MDRREDGLAIAERRFREGEARVARLRAIVDALERGGHLEVGARGGALLATFERSLELMGGHLRLERELRGMERP